VVRSWLDWLEVDEQQLLFAGERPVPGGSRSPRFFYFLCLLPIPPLLSLSLPFPLSCYHADDDDDDDDDDGYGISPAPF
jgi:hypothetical protein